MIWNAAFGKPDADTESRLETFSMARSSGQDAGRNGWLGIFKLTRQRGNPMEVIELDADGPAARAGIRKGDVIVSLNGAMVEKLSGEDVARAMMAAPGTSIGIKIKRGSEIVVVAVKTI